jgi:hypothetical protein
LGSSFIAGPQGEILAQASRQRRDFNRRSWLRLTKKMYVRTGRSLETNWCWNITKRDRLIMTTNNRRFPAEWENQQGILLCFPHNGRDWPENTKRFNGRLLNSSKKWLLMKRYFL